MCKIDNYSSSCTDRIAYVVKQDTSTDNDYDKCVKAIKATKTLCGTQCDKCTPENVCAQSGCVATNTALPPVGGGTCCDGLSPVDAGINGKICCPLGSMVLSTQCIPCGGAGDAPCVEPSNMKGCKGRRVPDAKTNRCSTECPALTPA